MIAKKELDSVLSTEYQPALWRQVLTDVFGVRNLNRQPQSISLPANKLAKSSFELGFFNTTDDRIIGLYQIDLKPNVQIERNKVGLRELLRTVYKHDVDGALVVFAQGDKWRLSFISEVRVLNDDGSVDKKATEPKRYTYLLGRGEKTRTPTDRLAELSGKPLSLEDVRRAFSVEALNTEFYKKVSEQFYKLVGSTTSKGKKTFKHEQLLTLPGISEKSAQARKLYQEFAVRLIGRTVFCWFLKVKQSSQGLSLLPEHLLSSGAVRENKNYYHTILEPLFFQTLNTKIEDRIADLPEGSEQIPFLNGGLFEPQPEDFYEYSKASGYSKHLNTLKIPDDWFVEFFEKLEQYNFTIDENSALDVEISVDPEMLGRIFENLLAEIDPDSGETARKATGSFYTPREIVNYMVDESLLIYLKGKLQSETVGFQALARPQATMWGNESRKGQFELEQPLSKNRWQGDDKKAEAILRRFFSYGDDENPFSDTETEILLKAIDNCKILDPACGSGAFPMGVLHRLVHLLGKLDKGNEKWKEWQKRKAIEATREAFDIGDKDERGKRLAEINDVFANNEDDYGRKIFLIENCIYGVDIQPIAAEISKLRCFLTLIVDETIDDRKENRGVKPLPNLEFKFVTADALVKLPESGLFNSDAQLTELQKIRHEYLQSYGKKKAELKEKFKELQSRILDKQIANYKDLKDERALKLSTWKPFEHEKTDWFDPLWMFGVDRFDLLIGNPPYIKEYTNKGAFDGIRGSDFYQGKMDIWYYFACHFLKYYTKQGDGLLTFIATNNWVTNSGASKLRKKIAEDITILELIDFGNTKIFSSADIQTMILVAKNANSNTKYKFNYGKITSDAATLIDAVDLVNRMPSDKYFRSEPIFDRAEYKESLFVFSGSSIDLILEKIKRASNFHLDEKAEVAQGIVPNPDVVNSRNITSIPSKIISQFNINVGDGVFVVPRNYFKTLANSERKYLKPIYEPYLIDRYSHSDYDKEIIYFTKKNFKNDAPTLISHLQKFRAIMEERRENQQGKIDYYHLHWARNEAFFQKGGKILSVRKCARPTFLYIEEEAYVMMAFNVIRSTRINLKYLSGLLNSKLIAFWLQHRGKMQGFQFQVDKEPLLNIPIKTRRDTKVFAVIVEYLFFLNGIGNNNSINEYVPNSHVVEQFEEVIDAMVYELYFEEDFRREDIAFIKHAERDFPPIEGLSQEKKIETIHAAYQKLRQKDNEIRNNLKLMDIRLADLIMPIKTAR
jgi:hypothetical protein